MEERVRVCRACQAMVGWFALFCETCGEKQPPHGAASEAGSPASAATAPTAQTPRPPLEDEVRTHLTAPQTDARAVARDLFQAQLRLIHRHREAVEELLRDTASLKESLASASRLRDRRAARAALDELSRRMLDTEERWGDLQVADNKDSEMLEEESREHMEAADFDAYLTPDETAKVEGEFAALKEQVESVDTGLRDVGRAVALARQEGSSRYLATPGQRGKGIWVLVLVTAGLVAWTLFSAFSQPHEDPLKVASLVGPPLAALLMWVIYGFSRRG